MLTVIWDDSLILTAFILWISFRVRCALGFSTGQVLASDSKGIWDQCLAGRSQLGRLLFCWEWFSALSICIGYVATRICMVWSSAAFSLLGPGLSVSRLDFLQPGLMGVVFLIIGWCGFLVFLHSTTCFITYRVVLWSIYSLLRSCSQRLFWISY